MLCFQESQRIYMWALQFRWLGHLVCIETSLLYRLRSKNVLKIAEYGGH